MFSSSMIGVKTRLIIRRLLFQELSTHRWELFFFVRLRFGFSVFWITEREDSGALFDIVAATSGYALRQNFHKNQIRTLSPVHFYKGQYIMKQFKNEILLKKLWAKAWQYEIELIQ